MAFAPVFSQFLDLLFPPHCVSCHEGGTLLCTECLGKVRLLAPPWCNRCGAPLPASRQGPHSVQRKQDCSSCSSLQVYLTGVRIAAEYGSPIREAIHHLKYKRQRQLAVPLGQVLVSAYTSYKLQADLLAPVPLHPSRQAERGFNQSHLLAQELGRHLQLPVQSVLVQRQQNTRPQVGLSVIERKRNVAGAFSCPPTTTELVRGKTVLLIDDVSTTGATLNECARALQGAGAAAVWGLALAISVPSTDRSV